MVFNTTLNLFPVANAAEYIYTYKHHYTYVNKSPTLTDTAKPEQFTDNMKWIDWYPTIINFLRESPARNGVPLSYLCRPTNVQEKYVYNNFTNVYVNNAPLVGNAFTTNAAGVHIYIARFTSVNTFAEAKMVAHAEKDNSRLEFMTLKDHLEVAGLHVVNAVQADKVLKILYYSGEKKPHMLWGKFERQLSTLTIVWRREAFIKIIPD